MFVAWKRTAVFVIAAFLSFCLLGQIVFADDIPEAEGQNTDAVTETAAEDPAAGEMTAEEPEIQDPSENVDLMEAGWSDDGLYYYDEEGNPVTGWQEIDGWVYYFESDGQMVSNDTLWLDGMDGQWGCFRFDANGHRVSGWYTDEWGYSYYYLENGAAASGLTEVNGDLYYFYADGEMARDNSLEVDGRLIIIDDNGIVTDIIEFNADGWTQVGSDYYYAENGSLVKDDWRDIDGYRYYFYWNGHMAADTTYWINGHDYRFDENGHMVTGWYDGGYGNWYYYHSDGKAAEGLTTVGGKQYYFYYGGYMASNTTVTDSASNKIIVIGDDGVVTSSVDMHDGWVQAGNDWYYFENGNAVNGWKKIGSYWYYFDYNGRMYSNTSTSIWNENTGEYEYYRFDANGHMITGWYNEVYWKYYYLGSGKAASGVLTVDGVKHCFGEDGRMLRNTNYVTETSLIIIDEEGVVTAEIPLSSDGWKKVGTDYYYVYQGFIVMDQLMDIDGYTYGFDNDGKMYSSRVVEIYSDGEYIYYGFDSSGHMVKDGWLESFEPEYGWYYFDSDGRPVTGLQTIGGVQYCFNWMGKMYVSVKIVENNDLYVIDASGKATVYKGANGWVANTYYVENGKLVENGWKKISGYWYYFQDGMPYRSGERLIDNKYYYFDTSGAMKTGWIKAANSAWYFANSSGALKCNEWFDYGNARYYFNGTTTVRDIITIDDKTYLFNTDSTYVQEVTGNNKWVKNDKYWYYLKSDGTYACDEELTVSNVGYYFDYYGRMATEKEYWSGYEKHYGADGKQSVSAWVEYGGNWRFFDENGRMVTSDWKKIASKWYYFDASGYMVMGDRVIDNKTYHFSNSGVWDGKSGVALKTGWNLVSGDYYYFDGSSIYTGEHKIGNNTYYFKPDGAMVHDSTSYEHIYTSSGAMLKNAWYKDQYGQWYYALSDGTRAQGLTTVGGKQYYFSYGRMVTSYVSASDNVFYDIASNGVVNKTIKASGTQWIKYSGGWLYCKNGLFVNGAMKINGTYYYFYNGVMQTNYQAGSDGYFGSDGKLVTKEGWVKNTDGSWSYLFNGNRVYGSKYIDGKWYYFNINYQYGYGYTSDGIYFVDGAFYKYAGSSGGRTKLNFTEGWNKYGSNWYYVKDGYLAKSQVMKIGSKYYLFDQDGKMSTTDQAIYYYGVKYLQANGTFLKNSWKKIDGVWYYFGADGNALTGKWTIGGTTYDLKTPPYTSFGGKG